MTCDGCVKFDCWHNAAYQFAVVVHVWPNSFVVRLPWCDRLRIGSAFDHALHLLLLLSMLVPRPSLDPLSCAIVSPTSVIHNVNRHCRAPIACAPSLIVLNCFPRRKSSVFGLMIRHRPHSPRQRPISWCAPVIKFELANLPTVDRICHRAAIAMYVPVNLVRTISANCEVFATPWPQCLLSPSDLCEPVRAVRLSNWKSKNQN